MKKTLLLGLAVLLVAALAMLFWSPKRASQGSGAPAANPAATAPAGAEAAPTATAPLPAPLEAQDGRTALAAGAAESGAAAAATAGTAALKLRLVDGQGAPLASASGSFRYRQEDYPDFGPGIRLTYGAEEKAAEQELAFTTGGDGRAEARAVESGRALSLQVGGGTWARDTKNVAPLLPGEVRDLGDVKLAPGATVQGRVLDPSGRPLAGARVEWRESGQASVFAFDPGFGGAGRQAKSDGQGGFHFEGMTPGAYVLHASHPGFVEQTQTVELEPGQRRGGVELKLGQGGALSGVVTDQAGQPLAAARVVAVGVQGMAVLAWQRERLLEDGQPVQADGGFVLDGLSPQDSHQVLAAAPGYAFERSGAVQVGGKIEIRLAPVAAVRGVVVDAGGQPVAGAQVTLEPHEERDFRFFRLSEETGADGGFAFDDVELGVYDLKAVAAAGEAALERVEVVQNGAPLRVVIPQAAELIVAVRDAAGRPVAGAQVKARPAGAGPSDLMSFESGGGGRRMRVERGGPSRGRTSPTDAQGRARFGGLTAGNWSLEVVKQGFGQARQEVERVEGEEQEVQVQLDLASVLRVTMVDTGGAPVAQGAVELSRQSDGAEEEPVRKTTDAWGLAVWTDLPPGEYLLRQGSAEQQALFVHRGDDGQELEAPRSAEPGKEVRVGSGEIIEERLVVASKAILRVQVARFGQPVPGASVRLSEPAEGDLRLPGFAAMGHSDRSATTDAEGWAVLPPCEPGKYEVAARAQSHCPETVQETELLPGTQELRLDLPAGTVRGMVMEGGNPVAGAKVHLLPVSSGEGGSEPRAQAVMVLSAGGSGGAPAVQTLDFTAGQTTLQTRPDGSFEFQDVPAGRYRLRAEASGFSPQQGEAFEHDGDGTVDAGVLFLERGASLHGSVLNLPAAEGEGFGSFRFLSLMRDDGERFKLSAVGADGRYEFREVPPGRYKLRFGSSPDGSQESEFIELKSGDDRSFDFVLP